MYPLFWSIFGIGLLLWLRSRSETLEERSARIDAKILSRPDLLEVILTPDEKASMVGNKLTAIKSVKDRTGLALADAYAVIDYWSRHANDENSNT